MASATKAQEGCFSQLAKCFDSASSLRIKSQETRTKDSCKSLFVELYICNFRLFILVPGSCFLALNLKIPN